MNIRRSALAYETWLRTQLQGEVVEDDLCEKHRLMGSDAFTSLRATYWRWAETVLKICPDLGRSPTVLAVGDIHLENFGIWRDREGRLVWGVNDFDEAAEMAYVIDIVRLATSALLADVDGYKAGDICNALLSGYVRGLHKPEAIVLDSREKWLRKRFEVGNKARKHFWRKLREDAEAEGGRIPHRCPTSTRSRPPCPRAA